jgi:hypothetical protein
MLLAFDPNRIRIYKEIRFGNGQIRPDPPSAIRRTNIEVMIRKTYLPFVSLSTFHTDEWRVRAVPLLVCGQARAAGQQLTADVTLMPRCRCSRFFKNRSNGALRFEQFWKRRQVPFL